jgi:RNA polymerase sigma-70 factor (ECF subfamily)
MIAPACTPTTTDEHLVERVRAGEVALYGVLMRRHSRRLHSVAARILESETDAEDAVQEAHLHVLARLDQFAGRSSFLTWLTRIVMNEALMRRRARRPSVNIDVPAANGGPNVVLISGARDPEQEVLQEEMRRILHSALGALPEKYRSVFRMREVDEVDADTVAHKLGISHECVKTRLHRAKVLLRTRLRSRMGSIHARKPVCPGRRRGGRMPKAA